MTIKTIAPASNKDTTSSDNINDDDNKDNNTSSSDENIGDINNTRSNNIV